MEKRNDRLFLSWARLCAAIFVVVVAIATSTAPWCNSTTPRNYRAPELSSPPTRPIGRAHQLPSRIGAHLFYPDGRVTTLDGHPVKAAP